VRVSVWGILKVHTGRFPKSCGGGRTYLPETTSRFVVEDTKISMENRKRGGEHKRHGGKHVA